MTTTAATAATPDSATTTTTERVVPADEIRLGRSRSVRFEGRGYGSGSSFFYVDNDPGEGPGLHRHPYTETFHVVAGEASLTVGDTVLVATTGGTVVVPADTWHGFTNTGSGPLRIMCIHASDVMIQEWRAED